MTLSSKRAALAAQLAALDAEEAKAAEAMECARLRPTIDEGEASDIATVLLDRRERGLRIVQLDALPSSLRSIEDVYAVHAAMCSISSTLGDHIGFKVGAAGAAAMKSMGLVEPFRAPLFATSIVKSASEDRDTCFPPSSILACEAEVAFVLDRDLPARPGSGGGGGEGGGHLPYCETDVWDAVSHVCPAIEVCGSRYGGAAAAGANPLHKVADDGLNVACVLGAAVGKNTPGLSVDYFKTIAVEMSSSGGGTATGTGANVLGSPLSSLAWLANSLATSAPDVRALSLYPNYGSILGRQGRRQGGLHISVIALSIVSSVPD